MRLPKKITPATEEGGRAIIEKRQPDDDDVLVDENK